MRSTISTFRKAGCSASTLLMLSAALGCGPGSATVSGRVTYNGTPLTRGDILIYGANGKVQSGPIGTDGHYTIFKAPVGDVKVAVAASRPSTPPPTSPGMRRIKGVMKHPRSAHNPSPSPVKVVPIPERYKDPDKSGLSFTLKSGEQTINLDLTP